jgi:hypothetical protein
MIKKIKIKIYERRAPLSATSIIWFTESEGQRLYNYIDSKAFVSVPLKQDIRCVTRHYLHLSAGPLLSSVFLEGGEDGLQNL